MSEARNVFPALARHRVDSSLRSEDSCVEMCATSSGSKYEYRRTNSGRVVCRYSVSTFYLRSLLFTLCYDTALLPRQLNSRSVLPTMYLRQDGFHIRDTRGKGSSGIYEAVVLPFVDSGCNEMLLGEKLPELLEKSEEKPRSAARSTRGL